jgi:hypothetical protein
MKRSTTAVIIGVLALGLVGGGTAVALTSNNPETVATDAPTATPEPTTPDPETTPADDATEPLTAETPAALDGDAADAKFLEIVRGELLPDTQIGNATDAQLIAAGHDACQQATDHVPWEDIRVIKDEKPAASGYYMDTSAVLFGAQQIYCPETIQDVG